MIRLVTWVRTGYWTYLWTGFTGLECMLMWYPTSTAAPDVCVEVPARQSSTTEHRG